MFAGFIGHPILGYWLVNKDFKLDDRKLCILGLIILAVSLAVFVYLGYTKTSLIRYENLPNMFI